MGEIQVRGAVTSRALPLETAPGAGALAGRILAEAGGAVAEDIVAELRALDAPAVVIRLDSPGGLSCRSSAIAEAIRGPRVPSVAFVERAWSGAPLIAAACTCVVLAPGEWAPGKPRLVVHAPVAAGYPPEVERAMAADLCGSLAARSGVNPGRLMQMTYGSDLAAGLPSGSSTVAFPPALAIRYGLADYVGTIEDARDLARLLAHGARPDTTRQRILAEKLHHHQENAHA